VLRRPVEPAARSGHSLSSSFNGEPRAAGVPSLACLRPSSRRKARAQVPAFPKSTGRRSGLGHRPPRVDPYQSTGQRWA